jgi:photosystem II stability/assembly factor-like uncharacterized protein
VVRSLDQGETWEQLNLPQVTTLGTYGEDNVIVGLYGGAGLLQSGDAGETWKKMNKGLISSSVYTTAIDIQGHTFAGTALGVFRSKDAGDTWEHYGLDKPVYELLITPSKNLFARTNDGVYRTSTETMDWHLIETLPLLRGHPWTGGLLLALGSQGHLFALEHTVGEENDAYLWRSSDEGETWQSIKVPLAHTLMLHPNGDIFLGDVISNNRQGIYRSSDDGQTWEQVTDGLTSTTNADEIPHIITMIVDEAGRIFAGTGRDGIFRSIDGGNSWKNVSGEVVENQIESMIVWNGKLFVGSGLDGVFVTEDGGDTWMPLNTNLANTSIKSLSIDTDGHLVAGTGGNGVWRTEVPVNVSIEEQSPEKFSYDSALQGYPNPFHGGATLAFTLSAPTLVRLSVYDIMGREVAVLLDEQKASGYHTAPFNADGLSSGVYFVTLSTSHGTFREQMLLVK